MVLSPAVRTIGFVVLGLSRWLVRCVGLWLSTEMEPHLNLI
jgi:hypothetical protein